MVSINVRKIFCFPVVVVVVVVVVASTLARYPLVCSMLSQKSIAHSRASDIATLQTLEPFALVVIKKFEDARNRHAVNKLVFCGKN